MTGRLIHVVKLGGSLLDLPDLPQRLQDWLSPLRAQRVLIVVGGSASADVVRQWDQMHAVGEMRCHWLATRAMQFNTYMVQTVMPSMEVVYDLPGAELAWKLRPAVLADPLLWLRHLEFAGTQVPHRWTFTSDSIAALLARQIHASRLTLLKSTLPTQACVTTEDAALAGLVDEEFPVASQGLAVVEAVNLRSAGPDTLRLQVSQSLAEPASS